MKFYDKGNSLKYLKGIFETAGEGIFIVDADGRLLRSNPTFDKLLGYEKDELKGKLFTEIAHKDAKVQKITSTSKIHHFHRSNEFPMDMEFIHKGGIAVPVRLRSTLIKDEKGKVVEAIGIVEDLREDKGERKLVQKVWETQETLHNVLANSGDAIFVADANGRITIVNGALLQMLGYQEDEIVGKHLIELSPYEGNFTTTTREDVSITEEYLNHQIEKANELFEKGKVTNYELYLIHKDGKIVPIEATISVLKDQQGERRGSIAICRDITERKKAEEEIKESRDFLENIFKTSADGIIVTDSQGFITMVNEAVERMIGYSQDELIGKHTLELSAKGKEYKEKGKKFVTKLFEEGFVVGAEHTWLRKDGSLVDTERNVALFRDSEGNITGAVASIRDITERKKAEEALKKSEEKYHSVIENASDAIISTNKEGMIITFNKRAEEMFGHSHEEILGKPFLLLATPNERGRQRDIFRKFETNINSTKKIYEGKGLKKDGQEFDLESSVSFLEVHGEYIITSFLRDISERKSMEHKLLQSEKLKSLGELAGGVAHDFNNILAAILGRVQLLRMQIDTPPGKEERRKSTRDLKKSLDVIEKASLDGAETVRRIQEFSRRREEDKYFTPVDLNKAIEDALEFTKVRWKNEAESKGTIIHVKKKLSPLSPIAGSAPELREVITNLINNAIDAMPQGGEIRIKTLMDNRHVVIKFEDTGSGIPKAFMYNIFDPFFTTKGPKATGLGLSVSYGIINRHGGNIKVDSIEDQGTTFSIQLPLSEQTGKEENVISTSKEERKARILVIEDEQDVRDLLKDILTEDGHEVKTTPHGNKGIKVFRQNHFDLVFTDLGMPGMSGWQVAEEIKKINRKTPVALITGWGVQLNHSELKKSGVDFVVNKPFEVDQVLRLVQEGIEPKRKGKTR
ncbi:MAG: hypothetical protein AMJ42_00335 [Deltaproteobacteria bacterium DG_8]|nr:MAG: hypothetical protein AMJ42_00335 [Deltaproteobacteria bacterium DG_8]